MSLSRVSTLKTSDISYHPLPHPDGSSKETIGLQNVPERRNKRSSCCSLSKTHAIIYCGYIFGESINSANRALITQLTLVSRTARRREFHILPSVGQSTGCEIHSPNLREQHCQRNRTTLQPFPHTCLIDSLYTITLETASEKMP